MRFRLTAEWIDDDGQRMTFREEQMSISGDCEDKMTELTAFCIYRAFSADDNWPGILYALMRQRGIPHETARLGYANEVWDGEEKFGDCVSINVNVDKLNSEPMESEKWIIHALRNPKWPRD